MILLYLVLATSLALAGVTGLALLFHVGRDQIQRRDNVVEIEVERERRRG